MNGPLGEIVKKFQKSRADKVAVVRLDGVIGHVGAGRGMTIDSVEPMFKRAFETERVKAVVIVINSPGGSPAQSEYIAERIRQLSSEKGVPVLAFCEDIAASGGYWIACAADEIFAAHTSLVGSIGVVSSGFGFNEVIDRLGVQRRLYTAGDNKARLDAFSPENADDVEWLKGMQSELHQAFIAWVKQRRGKKLAGTDEELFNGDIWIGAKARDVGLVDGIGVMRSVVAERYPDVEITVISAPKPILARLLSGPSGAAALTDAVVSGVLSAVEKTQRIEFR
ncbi:S49 family peptidase [Gordonia sp. w5E2]|uniref:Peptidase S49 n=1 Tax=Gordonia jacobaea TaxID=122202 RepID=A0ABR5I8Z4_9ACTN|nr:MULTISPECIES: S49 family peptidase [Gordonia]KNA90168.1 peptidase S49 [Gordonia jacobaea]OBC05529.1 peptidase S49 [Gordonia sp. 852002-50816_SCH5313054-a]OBC10550.1 peptidase S49 [Gordonia sp. 852002-50395_SCH5434458]OBC11286.1 peptidase S49 [Gordonia sp. 852002-50816_SCH5313054-c]